MDRDRFDALARLLATRGSRRGALSALLGAALFGHDPTDGLAKPDKKKRRGKAQGKGKDSGRDKDKSKDRGKGKDQGRRQKGRGADNDVQAQANGCCGNLSCTPPSPGNNNKGDCNFAGQDLSGGNHEGANFGNIDGRGTNFDNSNNFGANFGRACLQRATFRNADLRGANFGGACLFDADLTGARLVLNSPNITAALFCRTILPTAGGGTTVNNRDCNKGTRCCEACNDEFPCPDGQVCCNGRCRTGDCCATDDCPDRQCQTKSCDRNRCQYTPVTNGPGPLCSTTCCNGVCCQPNQVCDTRPNPDVCCTPLSDRVTCGVGTDTPRCGTVTNNCGQPVNCGECAPVTCRIVACIETTCAVTGNQPNRTACTTAAGAPGICCGGACVAGNCCANADCTGATNTCTNNQCRCGSGPACTEPNETCCGSTTQGVCIDTTTNPNNCGRCGNVCATGRCVGGQCAPCISNANCGAGRVCCGGNCFTGECCALRGPCGPDAPCCSGPNAPDRGCCIGRGTPEERCCLVSPAVLPPTVCDDGACCTDICLAGVPGSRLCGPRNITTCPG